MAVPDPTPAAQILERVLDHVVKSTNDFNKIPSPQYRYTQRLAELTAQLDHCMASLRQPRPQLLPGDENTIEDEIVHYAGEIKAVKKNGLGDFESAYQDEVSYVLQTVTDLLMTTIHPSYVKGSLQKIATGELKPYFPYDLVSREEREASHPQLECASTDSAQSDGVRSHPFALHAGTDTIHQRAPTFCDPWLEDRLRRRTLSDEELPSAKKRRFLSPDHEQSIRKTSAQSKPNTTDTFEGRQREKTTARSPSEATVPQDIEYGGAGRDDRSVEQRTVAFQIVDADNQPIAVLEQAGPWGSKRVDAILQMPVQRNVKLRREHGLDQCQLNAICDPIDPSDKEGVKIVSCMIQACGDIMHQSCVCCETGKTGPFETCTMVDDELFLQCGNCVWSGQSCRGAFLTVEEEISSPLGNHPAPEAQFGTKRLSSPFPMTTQYWDVTRRPLFPGDAMTVPVFPEENSPSDDASSARSSDEL
ncbi:hypothetical protein NQ176_g4761 [Zarea fungicola]|uniref:Uncharacterized protein n=1 Tax=Zarea fungicola TaxID=93591 RepID=A0ACC1NBV2_9HYPO|nr:hypothetical protein NQ176_g4761 [Lecanicillium fungicola]